MTEPSARQGFPSHPDRIANANANNDDHNNHRVRFAEEGPESVIYQHNPRRLQDDEPSPPPGPAVFWDENESIAPARNRDRDSIANTANTANLAQYTFYREPTPPPYRPDEKGYGNDAASGRIAPASSAGGIPESERQLHLQPQRSNWSDDEEMSPAAKRKLLWIIVGVAIVIIIGVAVGVGVGLGVSMGRKSSAEAQEQSESSTTPPVSVIGTSPPPTPSATLDIDSSATSSLFSGTPSTISSSTITVPYRPPNPHSDCPAANNTMYQVPGSHKRFLRLCGIDYHGSTSSRDLSHMYTTSMADCMNSCASFDQCTAVGWGFLPGDTGKEGHRCYMKTDLKAGHAATTDWCFAILQ
ncbi:hypothetical protein QBC40DRAFT_107573 [Triangularia verruculosa]|uniref:Apple domain-containing protein n=1 Tax=Triangularia verruculosa TaxID=2587418 RepID=A0AAN7AQ86_9PEZI|nr:hypothetical protein QBC40DRAFT_107573 [Triangularia verruculosa]